jgi:hypothetical protein
VKLQVSALWRLIYGLGAIVLLLLAAALFLTWKFPFRRDAMIRRIEAATNARVEMGTFHEKWFPPGFSAEHVRLSDANGNILTIDAVALTGSYTGLFRNPKQLTRIKARGVRLVIPSAKNFPAFHARDSRLSVAVGEIRVDSATLRFLRDTQGKPPLEFLIHSLVLNNVGRDRASGFQISLHNPGPPGEIRSHGQFGPINPVDTGRTPVSGAFTFSHADLSTERGIAAATLNASGKFRGDLRRINCTGTADLPTFQVYGSNHSVHIASAFDVFVNALKGDVVMNHVLAHFNGTTVSASGNVANRQVTVDTEVKDGRVEDLLLLFTRREVAAMEGPITLQARFTIPPGPPAFLTRLQVNGEFDISRGHFTNPKAQIPVDRLSASGRGEAKQEQRENPTLTVADIRGSVVTRHEGVATLPRVVFQFPGLRGELAGSFGLVDKRIDMTGAFQTTGKMEDTTSGFKSLMLKALGPLWRRRASVQTVPFRVTGVAGHPVFRIQLH